MDAYFFPDSTKDHVLVGPADPPEWVLMFDSIYPAWDDHSLMKTVGHLEGGGGFWGLLPDEPDAPWTLTSETPAGAPHLYNDGSAFWEDFDDMVWLYDWRIYK